LGGWSTKRPVIPPEATGLGSSARSKKVALPHQDDGPAEHCLECGNLLAVIIASFLNAEAAAMPADPALL